MPRPATDKRERLTAAAASLAHTRGLERTTLGDIAAEAGVAPGSVYYYFKTKDDVGLAVVDDLLERFRARFEEWNSAEDPRDRLAAYVDSYVADEPAIRASGCPVGTLASEARKLSEELGDAAASVLRITIDWAAEQFEELGFAPEAARARALHLVTGIQGAAVLANALGEAEPLDREAAHLKRWVANTSA